MKTRYLFLTLLLLFNCSYLFCQPDSLQPGGIYNSSFIIDEIPRSVTYYMPSLYGKLDSYPLLIFLHDEGSSAKNNIKRYGDVIHAKADSLNCVVMYPDAVSGYWNSKANGTLKDSVNDVGFISIMLSYFIQQYHCDASRVYLSGIGKGGDMCYKMNCETHSNLAGIATINAATDASRFQNCNKKQTTPFVNIKADGNINQSINKVWSFLFSKEKSSSVFGN